MHETLLAVPIFLLLNARIKSKVYVRANDFFFKYFQECGIQPSSLVIGFETTTQ
jgi:hypothetical protein